MKFRDISSRIIGGVMALMVTGCDGAEEKTVQAKSEALERPLLINTKPRILAIGSGFSIGIKKDGTVWSWGGNFYRTLGRPINEPEQGYEPGQVEGISDAAAVTAGSVVVVLRKDGTVWTWGTNVGGALGYVVPGNVQVTPRQVEGLTDVVDVSIRGSVVHVLRKDGSVWGWGSRGTGFLGAQLDDAATPVPVHGLKDIVRIKPGFAIDSHGTLWSYGRCIMPLGRPVDSTNSQGCLEPAPVSFSRKVVDVVAGANSVYALTDDGFVWSWGTTGGPQLGLGNSIGEKQVLPRRITQLSRVTNIAGELSGGAAISDDGLITTWGVSALSPPPEAPLPRQDAWVPQVVDGRLKMPIQYFVGGVASYAAIDSSGAVWFWKSNGKGERGTGIRISRPDKKYWRTIEKSHWNYN